MNPHRFRACLARFLIIMPGLFGIGAACGEEAPDLGDLPFEELVRQEVVPASVLARQISDSPSAVAIVTADDIRAYGYRTLADVINSMRGLYTTYDHLYAYMGGRGFGRPGDYAGRIMVLIDGYATQDSLFNQAYIDESGLLDMEMIERVEYVPGTGSVTYGNNAMLGIINIVTRKGEGLNALQLSGEVASHGERKQRASFGRRFDNGADLLLSVSRLRVDGQDLYFPGYDTPASNNGIADGLDWRRGDRFFGKLSHEGLLVEGGFMDSRKMVPVPTPPNYSSATRFNAPYLTQDRNAFLNVRLETDLNLSLQAVTRLYLGRYQYLNSREYADFSDGLRYADRDYVGQWWGVDQKFVGNWFNDHSVLFGLEYRDDARQDFSRTFYAADGSFHSRENAGFSRQTTSLYLTDEYRINARWSTNAGVRFDHASDQGGRWSPRLALIYQPTPQTTWKASYSEAFRLPNGYERWSNENTQLSSPEQVAATELVLQHAFSPALQGTASLYRYVRRGPQYAGDAAGQYRTHGIESELEGHWNGVRLRTSVAWQRARDIDGGDLANSPDWLGKFNVTWPLPGQQIRAGLETQYVGTRLTQVGRRLGGFTLNHLTLSSARNWHGLSASFSIRNLFDRHYEVVAPTDWPQMDSLRMDGRTYWLQLNYDL